MTGAVGVVSFPPASVIVVAGECRVSPSSSLPAPVTTGPFPPTSHSSSSSAVVGAVSCVTMKAWNTFK